jgi:allophanate hydrolase
VQLAVVGAHLSGQPLNRQLTERGATLIEATQTSADYRLYALPGTNPPKPGLARVAAGGAPVAVEVWALSTAAFGSFVAQVPPPLGIGTVRLHDGRSVKGFICESAALDDTRDITAYGGRRAYREAMSAAGEGAS